MNINAKQKHITILGAGPAGLAAAYYAKQKQLTFTVFEAAPRVGGNCITYETNGFRFDSGAHRLHVKDKELTEIYKVLLGNDLLKVDAPSAIFYRNTFIDFPLSPLNLLNKLGPIKVAKAALSLLAAKFGKDKEENDFETRAVQTYGRYLANFFLLHYTAKLWGRLANQLSPEVSGARLKGLNYKTFIKEAFSGKEAKTQHIDGSFLYPRLGIGQLMHELEESAGTENFRTDARITRVFYEGNSITGIEINGQEKVATDLLISTLPLNIFPQLMYPRPSDEVIAACNAISFRNVVLLTFLLNKPTVTPHATIYFTTKDWLFTRVVEPRNRSAAMAPDGKTSLVVEVPVGDLKAVNVPALKEEVKNQLLQTRLIKENEIISIDHKSIPNAYPILELGLDKKRDVLLAYLNGFDNLHLSGRNASFRYTHIHDQFMSAKKIIEEVVGNNFNQQ